MSPPRLDVGAAFALRLATTVALGFSAASATEDYLVGHSFCDPGAACDAVRASALGQAIGPMLPAIGVAMFGGVLLGTLSTRRSRRRLALVGAMLAGIGGAALLAVQAVDVGAFCALCLGVDAAAVVGATIAAGLWRARGDVAAADARAAAVWVVAGTWVVGAPAVWATSQPPAIPDAVRAHYRPGYVNVVEWSDFECPHCRRMAPTLAAALDEAPLPVNFVRQNFPIRDRVGARAFRCAARQGAGESMADALFASDVRDAATVDRVAASLGLDRAALSACMADPEVDATIDAEKAALREAGLSGLPTVFIGPYKFEGFDANASAARYAEAIAAAAASERPRARVAGWGVLFVAGLAAGALARRMRTRRDDGGGDDESPG